MWKSAKTSRRAVFSKSGGNSTEEEKQEKKGRKELRIADLTSEVRELFTGAQGSDAKEWAAWRAKDACEVLGAAESARIRTEKPELIVPTRWVRTNKNEGLVAKDFLATSRLVVQGFKDKALGQYRRDARILPQPWPRAFACLLRRHILEHVPANTEDRNSSRVTPAAK
ncbi:hypothetical protein AK812_SmicGene3239 [Symbiodinium microadriaticum]|uniref:Uncharacterized protein n=1 Tax=Symbiodinium microadriaticum TaxID=2951 RepID=A0A1Q9EZH7_SYMMI|nr:hypothetical protein AK812_SmicGene3239 [Symbiodinium microadriaticum]